MEIASSLGLKEPLVEKYCDVSQTDSGTYWVIAGNCLRTPDPFRVVWELSLFGPRRNAFLLRKGFSA